MLEFIEYPNVQLAKKAKIELDKLGLEPQGCSHR